MKSPRSFFTTKDLAVAGLLTAVTLLFTLISISVPAGMGGAYVNLGDMGVYALAYAVGGYMGALCAAIASAAADLMLGSMIYVPATFVIKGLTALLCSLLFKRFAKKKLLAPALSGLIIPVGYCLFECLAFGPAAAVISIIPNLLQWAVGVALGIPCIRLMERLLDRK